MFLDDLLEKLTTELSLDLPPKKDGFFTLRLSKKVEVSFLDLSPGVSMNAKIIECPKTKREDLFIYLMRANLLGQGTGGARLGMDEKKETLTLSLSLPYELEYRAFKEALEKFANYVVYWQEEIEKKEYQPNASPFNR